ncbi:AEC family transporter [Spartinivicinus poritis]|uniref:AEC family transporter n=1 Tax=Spartinivicinus poritis TaxID=2994640 RepID=A0ABT5UG65_9GAMM|nr:AEC family transporter [Spartinivicinus sp. A2-2]MDE1465385.1 AEC family transporter [Spartinivicinus sp. A2-2]
MVDFLFLLEKVSFLFFLVLLGFVIGRCFTIELKTISTLLLYVLSPIVIFSGTAKAELTPTYLAVPIIFFVICVIFGLLGLRVGQRCWKDNTQHLFALSCSTANTGYFGLPVAMAILDDNGVALVIFSMLGITFYEYTIGFYITARGRFSVKKSLIKLAKIPFIYAFGTGLILNLTNFSLPDSLMSQLTVFKGAYTVLGMMLIGFSLANVGRQHIDWRLILLTTFSKYICWPLLIVALIFADQQYTQWLDQQMIFVMLLVAVVPLAANTIALAVELNVQPQKASVAVLTSTGLGIIMIPLYLAVLPGYLMNS